MARCFIVTVYDYHAVFDFEQIKSKRDCGCFKVVDTSSMWSEEGVCRAFAHSALDVFRAIFFQEEDGGP